MRPPLKMSYQTKKSLFSEVFVQQTYTKIKQSVENSPSWAKNQYSLFTSTQAKLWATACYKINCKIVFKH